MTPFYIVSYYIKWVTTSWTYSRICFNFVQYFSRTDDWNSDRPKEEGRGYDGPAGMEPDGTIESNWEEVCKSSLAAKTYAKAFIIMNLQSID